MLRTRPPTTQLTQGQNMETWRWFRPLKMTHTHGGRGGEGGSFQCPHSPPLPHRVGQARNTLPNHFRRGGSRGGGVAWDPPVGAEPLKSAASCPPDPEAQFSGLAWKPPPPLLGVGHFEGFELAPEEFICRVLPLGQDGQWVGESPLTFVECIASGLPVFELGLKPPPLCAESDG